MMPIMIQVIQSLTQADVDREVKSIREFTKKITKSKKTAREFLIRAGYITKSGKLTKRYR